VSCHDKGQQNGSNANKTLMTTLQLPKITINNFEMSLHTSKVRFEIEKVKAERRMPTPKWLDINECLSTNNVAHCVWPMMSPAKKGILKMHGSFHPPSSLANCYQEATYCKLMNHIFQLQAVNNSHHKEIVDLKMEPTNSECTKDTGID